MKGKNYSYYEHCYIEKNYPFIPVPIACSFKEYATARKLERGTLIGITDMSKEKDYIHGYCLAQDLEKVSKALTLTHNLVGESGHTYLDWLHDGLMDEFGDFEVEKRSHFSFINGMRERTIHKVIHYILDNIDKYCGYFIHTDCDYEWLYALYDDAKDGEIDSMYISYVTDQAPAC